MGARCVRGIKALSVRTVGKWTTWGGIAVAGSIPSWGKGTMHYLIGIALCFAGTLTFAQSDDEDPVVKVRAQRALSESQDLPPIPRGLTEPPPLPPPELHTHDIRRQRRGGRVYARRNSGARKSAAKGKGQMSAKAGAPHSAPHSAKVSSVAKNVKPSASKNTRTRSRPQTPTRRLPDQGRSFPAKPALSNN